jgi:hypothetical protein
MKLEMEQARARAEEEQARYLEKEARYLEKQARSLEEARKVGKSLLEERNKIENRQAVYALIFGLIVMLLCLLLPWHCSRA